MWSQSEQSIFWEQSCYSCCWSILFTVCFLLSHLVLQLSMPFSVVTQGLALTYNDSKGVNYKGSPMDQRGAVQRICFIASHLERFQSWRNFLCCMKLLNLRSCLLFSNSKSLFWSMHCQWENFLFYFLEKDVAHHYLPTFYCLRRDIILSICPTKFYLCQ